MNFWASLEYAVGVMIGSCSVIGVVGAKYRNHYAQIVMVGISVDIWVKVIDFSYKEGGAIEQYTFCADLKSNMAATKNYI